jgi:uncharacterized protein (DUF2235 family)
MEAYVNLASNYRDNNDSIYIFGFSRGAAAARALTAVISDPGLLPADNLDFFPDLWRYFMGRRHLGDAERERLRDRLVRQLFDPPPSVRFLGVFDTVAGSTWDMLRLFHKTPFPRSQIGPFG